MNFSANAALRCANVSLLCYVSNRRQNSVASSLGDPAKGSGRSVLSSAMLNLNGGNNNCKSGSSICGKKTLSFSGTKLSACGDSGSCRISCREGLASGLRKIGVSAN